MATIVLGKGTVVFDAATAPSGAVLNRTPLIGGGGKWAIATGFIDAICSPPYYTGTNDGSNYGDIVPALSSAQLAADWWLAFDLAFQTSGAVGAVIQVSIGDFTVPQSIGVTLDASQVNASGVEIVAGTTNSEQIDTRALFVPNVPRRFVFQWKSSGNSVLYVDGTNIGSASVAAVSGNNGDLAFAIVPDVGNATGYLYSVACGTGDYDFTKEYRFAGQVGPLPVSLTALGPLPAATGKSIGPYPIK